MSRARVILCAAFLGILFLTPTAPAQNQQSKQPAPFGAVPQMTTAQRDNFPPQLLDQLTTIKNAALTDEYAYRQVAYLTENIGPRLSGSVQANAAAEYVANELRRLGLEIKLEPVTVPHWIRGAETAELTEYPGQAAGARQKIILAALGGSTATPVDGISAEIVVVNNFDQLKGLGRENVAGKIVLYNEIFDQQKATAGLSFVAYGEAVRYRAAGAKAAAERLPRWTGSTPRSLWSTISTS